MTRAVEGERRRAREVLFRVAYQADVTGDSYADAWSARRAEERLGTGQIQLIEDVLGVLACRGREVDAALEGAAENWPLARLSATDRSVMRAAVAELMSRRAWFSTRQSRSPSATAPRSRGASSTASSTEWRGP